MEMADISLMDNYDDSLTISICPRDDSVAQDTIPLAC